MGFARGQPYTDAYSATRKDTTDRRGEPAGEGYRHKNFIVFI